MRQLPRRRRGGASSFPSDLSVALSHVADATTATLAGPLGTDVEAAANAVIASHPDLTDQERIVIQKLSTRDYHLPGNTPWQDLSQFVRNNHPLLAFCMAHPLHPFTARDRIFCLAGSLAFGLGATCAVWLYFYYRDQAAYGYHDTAGGGGKKAHVGPIPLSESVVGMAASVLNAWFDLFLWYMQMCPCCRPGAPHRLDERFGSKTAAAFIWAGQNLAGVTVICAAFVSTGACILRSTVSTDGDGGLRSFSFVRSWMIGVALSLTVVYPVMALTFFSGILGCFRLPVLGGRPSEVWREDRRRQRQRRQQQQQQKSDYDNDHERDEEGGEEASKAAGSTSSSCAVTTSTSSFYTPPPPLSTSLVTERLAVDHKRDDDDDTHGADTTDADDDDDSDSDVSAAKKEERRERRLAAVAAAAEAASIVRGGMTVGRRASASASASVETEAVTTALSAAAPNEANDANGENGGRNDIGTTATDELRALETKVENKNEGKESSMASDDDASRASF